MPKGSQRSVGDELFGTPMSKRDDQAGPTKGEFVQPPGVGEADEPEDALPEQEEFWRPPARFGTVGWNEMPDLSSVVR
jgi:hypothetical protein